MVPPDESPDDYYAQALEDTFSRGVWFKEYVWWPMGCDPCASEAPSPEDILAAGYKGDPYYAHFTRLHLRYTPEEATQDLMLYLGGDTTYRQVKYISYNKELESTFPICGGISPGDPGTCPDQGDGTIAITDTADTSDNADDEPEASGCGGGNAALPGVGLLMWRRRKRNHL